MVRGGPIEYSQAEYQPERGELAPGEFLVYTPTLKINQAGRVDIFRSFWNRDTDSNAALCSGGPAPVYEIHRNFPVGVVGNVRGGRQARIAIPDLPPGRYWLITSAAGPNGGQSVTEVGFVIIQPCGDGR